MPKLNVLVAGSTGYIGVQLIKSINQTSNIVKIKYLCGNSSVGKSISFFDKSLNFKKLPKITKFNKVYLKLSRCNFYRSSKWRSARNIQSSFRKEYTYRSYLLILDLDKACRIP